MISNLFSTDCEKLMKVLGAVAGWPTSLPSAITNLAQTLLGPHGP
jgi:hypothetical protein